MSGYIVIANTDGAPVSELLLRRMTDFMAYRGPDAQTIKSLGAVGMGHALLRTTREAANETQPCGFDGERWIVGDVRLDGRPELLSLLAGRSHRDLSQAPDIELVLAAYHVWGEDCVAHLLGDFSFVIWDGPRKSLFGARDHFGVKPFYYARVKNSLIVGNTLNAIRLHPDVSDEWNEYAIGDYLLVGSNDYHDMTFFRDIRRLEAAGTLVLTGDDIRLRRYWTMPIEDEIRFRRESDYVERFVELLDQAVQDRMRTDRIGIFMSGGMDSTTVAATAKKLAGQSSSPVELKAFSLYYENTFHDEEREYSAVAAEHMRLPIEYLRLDDYGYFESRPSPIPATEPGQGPLSAIQLDSNRLAAAHSRVVLSGQGGDVFLRPSANYLWSQFRNFNFVSLIRESAEHWLRYRRLPRIGIRTAIRRKTGRTSMGAYPSWLDPDFESRLNLKERFEFLYRRPPSPHPHRPEAYAQWTSPQWASVFEAYDAGNSTVPIEHRHPLFDLRLARFTLRLPSMPWCIDKHLMRLAMKNLLPEPILRRRKTPLPANSFVSIMKKLVQSLTSDIDEMHPRIGDYIRSTQIIESGRTLHFLEPGKESRDRTWSYLYSLYLNRWIATVERHSLCPTKSVPLTDQEYQDYAENRSFF